MGRLNIDWNIQNVILGVVLSLIILQAVGLIFGKAIGIDIYLGPVFILLAAAACAALSIAILKKMLSEGESVTKADVFAILVVASVSILMLFFLKDFVPEIFEQSLAQLQAVVMP